MPNYTYNAAAASMLQYVEDKLFCYRSMQHAIREYAADCTSPGRSTGGPSVRTAPGDPTAAAAERLLEPPPHIKEMQAWVAVIEKARDEMRYYAPELHEVLTRFFSLDARKHGAKRDASIRVRLMMELNISQTTLYARKCACVDWVKSLALYRGLICPELETAPRKEA